ncbi:MAG: ribosome-associated translation inhibitor RaiA [Candidatus Aminicenantes bacterium]|nr:ribosome-associated translation inhibitor RaiA [Candidatus Aminicenantes bacterium]
MNINYTGRQINITPEIREFCEKRIQNLDKLIKSPAEVDIVLSVEKYRYEAEINISSKGFTLNAAEETQDMLSSLGLAFENIERQVKKEIEKARQRKRRIRKEPESFSEEPGIQKQGTRIIRDQNYTLKPMSVDEAALLFDPKKKSVFVFKNIETQKWTVLYKRKDQNLGLIELESN